MNSFHRIISLFALTFMLSACGTTSGLKPTDTAKTGNTPASLAAYDKVIVLNFEDNAESKSMKGGEEFSKRIVSSVAATKAFSSVTQAKQPGKAVVISGKIREYKEGNAVLRTVIGFGAGSSYFDADVNFADNETGAAIGSITVDKNSWVLGGFVAGVQDVKSHMDSAAQSIAAELKKAKQGVSK